MARVLLISSLFLSLLCGKGELQLQNHEDCPSGIHCKRRKENITVCPAGFFCPESSITPVPCPPGTFRSEGAAQPSHRCLTCPVDFFNPMPGQGACLPCGSEAAQPVEGQDTCICLGNGQVFQPRDARCTCPPGYWSSFDDRRRCIRKVYDICRDPASRNQEGKCLTEKGWAHYCSGKVCTTPGDYEGYDKVLGLCICQADSLESVCNSQCRRKQKDILQFTCAEENAQLFITYKNGSKTTVFLKELRTVLLQLAFPLKEVCTSQQSSSSHPVYTVKTSGKGFLGVYNPDPRIFHNLIIPNEASSLHKNRPSSAPPADKSGPEEDIFSWLDSLRPSNSTSKVTFTGILNPIACIDTNVTIMFIASKEHYPTYDVNNLYNTNAGFDWGDFRSLAEEIREASSSFVLFLFQFHQPGTYVLRLSSNQHKKMYVKVMPLGGQCYEDGPFFPTTPRYAVQVGIAKRQDLLLKLDWTAIIGLIMGLLIFLIAFLLLILLCQRLSWSQKGITYPLFRRQQMKYNLDRYSSKLSTVFSIKKAHHGLQNKGRLDADSCSTGETKASFLKRAAIWEPEKQIDLEAFNTNVFFELLLKQSLSVTTNLGHFKEEVKSMYHKVTSEISSLKELWIMTLSIPEELEAYESTMIESYLKTKQQAEEEVEHRKQLAAQYEESVHKQMHLLHHDLKCQEEHYVRFNSALREALRLIEMLTNSVAGRGRQRWSPLDYPSLLAQIDTASSTMTSTIIKESHRLKAWRVLGEGMGAHLLDTTKTRILTKQELVDSNGSAKAPPVIHMDPTTGLLVPNAQCTMLPNSHCPGPVPTNHFLHPETGKVLPVAGNIGYDPVTSKLVCAVDSAAGELRKSQVPVFPYIPYPICPNTGLPVKTKLPALCPEKMFPLGGLMLDPVTAIEVPVLAVTIHPHTGQRLSVGGTYLNPLTGTVTPLEIGGPMTEPEGGKIVPILGVSLDSNTGEVLPVGGLVSSSGNPMLLGESFIEPLSGKTARIHGAHLEQDKVVPHAGSYRAILEADWLLSQTHVVNAVKQYRKSVLEDASLAADKLAALKASVEDMKKSFTITFYHAMHCLQVLEKKQKIASSLKSNGGKLGMIKYPGTEMWIPAVFGMKIPDPHGSNFMVPILGIDCDRNPRQPSPLAGTMEDADGQGLVPIAIGARTISPLTGETGPVIGAQTNPWTHNVIPTIQSLGALPRGATDPDLLDRLENEINLRQGYWHCRKKEEEELLQELNSLFLHVLDAAKKGKIQEMKHEAKLKSIEKICHFLKQSTLQEAERRASKHFSSHLGTELPFLCKVDRNEKEQEIQVLLEVRKAMENLMQFMKKMQLQEEQIQMRWTEKDKQGNPFLNTKTAATITFRKVTLALASEFQKCILQQQAKLETAYTRLEYVRERSAIQTQQAKVLFSGSRRCFENYQTAMFYGIMGFSHGTGKIIHQKLIPLLKSVVYMLEESSERRLSPETPGYSSRSTLKASATHSEALRSETSQETASASTGSSLLPTVHTARIRHLKQEMQTRLCLEKHACELAHLELTLMMEEISTISYFYESSKAKEKEDQKGNWGIKSSKKPEATSTKDSLLKELSEHHHHAEQTLCQKHLEEIKYSGLNQDLAAPKQSLHFLEEILHHLSVCHPGLQTPDSNITEQEKAQTLEAEAFPNSVTQILHISAMKIVKLEALRQVCLYRVLDLYNNLQRLIFPESVTRILNSFNYKSAGEEATRTIAKTRETQQVARAVAFLQRHHQEGELLVGLQAAAEAELRTMRAQFRQELQTQTEEQIQAKEMRVIREAEGQGLGSLVSYFLLSQRHLRQTVTMLQDCCRLQETAWRSRKEGRNLELPVLQELLPDDDMRGILHFLKDNTEYVFLVLEYIQAAQLLQLRESQFKEVARSLKVCIQEKCVDDANTTANQLQKLRLKEQLKVFLGNKRAEKNTSRTSEPLQNVVKQHSESQAFLGKDFHLDLEELTIRLEGGKERDTDQNNCSLSSITEHSRIPGTHHKAADQLLLFLTKNTKVLKHTGHLVASRIVLLNPHFTPPPPLHEARSSTSSFQDILDSLMPYDREITVIHPPALSAREFVIYQYGLSILQFLKIHIDAPEIHLCVASSIPFSNATGNAFRNSFFYQNSKRNLFVQRDCLASVGSFLLLLVHCFAHIVAADFNEDSNPAFLKVFYQALKACFSEMFSLRLQMSAVLQGNKFSTISEMVLREEPFSEGEASLISQLFEIKVKSLQETGTFEKHAKGSRKSTLPRKLEKPLSDRLSVKRRDYFLHAMNHYDTNSSEQRTCMNFDFFSLEESSMCFSPSELEDKVNVSTEELVNGVQNEQIFNSIDNEDLLFDHLESSGSEKDLLVKQMHALEEKIVQSRRF